MYPWASGLVSCYYLHWIKVVFASKLWAGASLLYLYYFIVLFVIHIFLGFCDHLRPLAVIEYNFCFDQCFSHKRPRYPAASVAEQVLTIEIYFRASERQKLNLSRLSYYWEILIDHMEEWRLFVSPEF